MYVKKIGPVEIIIGENSSRTPFSTSLAIKGKHESILIDCGSGMEAFKYIHTEHNIDKIYLTHHHLDHTWGAYLFPNARKFINPLDLRKAVDIKELVRAQGFPAVLDKEQLEEWIRIQENQSFPGSDVALNRNLQITDSYSYDQVLDGLEIKMTMIHSPGHTEGYCCPYLPDYGIFFVGDFDLTSFGPFYCDADGDIDLFIASAKKTLEIEAKYYVTAHQKGVLLKEEYQRKLANYLSIIDKREEKINCYIKAGKNPKELTNQGIFYYEHQNKRNPFYLKSEKLGIAKHLRRLLKNGEPIEEYYRAFISAQNMNEEFIDYQSDFKANPSK